MNANSTHNIDNTNEAQFLAPETHQRAAGQGNKRKKSNLLGQGAHKRELTSLLRENARKHRLNKVFSDFCELAALAFSNSVDKFNLETREARYMQIVGAYERAEVFRFSEMLAVLTDWLACGFEDCLGDLFMSFEFGDDWKGQFFTPYPISSMMAQLALTDAQEKIQKDGFITISEPACGAGGMVIACADAISEMGLNYQQTMHVTAVDIDATAIHMTYLQLSLLNIPAIVVHGNSLSMKEWSRWVTPAHVLGGWSRKLRNRADEKAAIADCLGLSEPIQESQPVQAEPIKMQLDFFN